MHRRMKQPAFAGQMGTVQSSRGMKAPHCNKGTHTHTYREREREREKEREQCVVSFVPSTRRSRYATREANLRMTTLTAARCWRRPS